MGTDFPSPRSLADDFLVPVPRLDEGIPNSIALATWHLALSNMLGTEIPHDLMGIWLFPASGGVILLAPEALAQDHVPIAPPTPRLAQAQLYELEELFRTAGYRSSIAVPISGPTVDLGLLGFGDLRQGLYGPDLAIRLHAVARGLVPTFEALAESPPVLSSDPGVGDVDRNTLPARLSEVVQRAGSGPDLVRLASGVLQAVLPHDRLELVAGGGTGDETPEGPWQLLSGSRARRRWGEQNSRAQQMIDQLVEAQGAEEVLSLRDLREETPGLSWPTYFDSREGRRIRSFLGARLQVGSRSVGYVFLGAVAPGAFHPEDEELLPTVAAILAPRVHALELERRLEVSRAVASGETATDRRVVAATQVLALTAHWGEALRQFAGEVRLAIPFDHLDFALRLGEGTLGLVEPGDTVPLGHLSPMTEVDEPVTAVAAGDQGAQIYSLPVGSGTGVGGEALVVPLRVAGRPVGVMRLSGIRLGEDRAPISLAQQFADVVAPHLEMLRRAHLRSIEPRAGTLPSR